MAKLPRRGFLKRTTASVATLGVLASVPAALTAMSDAPQITLHPTRSAVTQRTTSRDKSGYDSQVASIRALVGSGKHEPMRTNTLSTPCLNQ